jgi:Tol biopolymer transport system component
LAWDSPAAARTEQTIFAIGKQSRGELVALNASGEATKVLLGGLPAFESDFSPVGEWVAYTRYPEHSVWTAKPDGSQAQQVSPTGMEVHQPHWSPDGKQIAFIGRPPGPDFWRIYVMPAIGGGATAVLPGGESQGVPTWSRDGYYLYFGCRQQLHGEQMAVVRRVDLRTKRVDTIPTPVPMWTPRISPDGRFLVALSYDNHAVYIRENATQNWRKIAEMAFVEEPTWSGDSSFVQFSGFSGDRRRTLYRFRVLSARLEPVADITRFYTIGDAWFGVAPDGSPLGFQGRDSHQIYALEWR